MREIAQIVAEEFSGCDVSMGPASADNRSYRVNFARIHRELPGFRCGSARAMAHGSCASSSSGSSCHKETYQFRAFTRLKQLQYLQSTGQIDAEFYWRSHAV